MPASLTLHPPERAARFLILRDGETLIVGRHPHCGLVLDDPRVSRRQARLSWDGAGWRIEDLASKNGTSVNGQPASGAMLGDGDWVNFGGLLSRFQRLSEEEAKAAAGSERLARLPTSVDLRRRLTAEFEPLDLLQRLLGSAMKVGAAERGFVLIMGPDGTLRAEVVAGFTLPHLSHKSFGWSVGVVERVLRSGASLVLGDVQADAELGRRPTVVRRGIRRVACLPLRMKDQVIGLIYVDNRKEGPTLTPLDIEILETLAEHAALLVSTMRLDHRIRSVLGATDGSDDRAERELLDTLRWKIEAVTRGLRGPRVTDPREPR